MDIDTLLKQAQQLGSNTMTLPPSWGQGRTAFGGISAAVLYSATKTRVPHGRHLRSLTTNFVGPLLSDVPFSIEIETLRDGANASQYSSRIVQDGKVAVIQQSSFGAERLSSITVENNEQHGLPPASSLNRVELPHGVAPDFLQHIDLAITDGALPYSGSEKSYTNGWMRFKQTPESITDAHVICLIDAWPPAVLQMMKEPKPASTMMWNLEFIHPHQPMNPDDWFAYRVNTRQAAGGYAHAEANIWDSAGELIAISRQSIAIFA